MDTYSLLREIADSWGLLAMMLFFIGAVLMLFRPGANKMHKDASEIPFREDPPSLGNSKKSTRPKSEQPLEG
jgi:cytochrome c oxidase cbb3-type subunit 4